MKKVTTAILITATMAGAVSCKKDVIGEGPVITQTRTTLNFTGIDLRMNGNVYYTKGSDVKLEITAKESIHSMLQTYTENNNLIVRYSNGKTYDNDESIRINVTAPDVTGFMLNTSGNIYCMSDIQPANLYLRTSGSGSIYLQKVVTNAIDAASTQSGRISAGTGTAMSEKLRVDGSGKIDLSGISVKTATTHTEGSGDIRLRATEHLDVTIKGSGSVYFSGNPFISTHISGSGYLVRL